MKNLNKVELGLDVFVLLYWGFMGTTILLMGWEIEPVDYFILLVCYIMINLGKIAKDILGLKALKPELEEE